jgi:glutamate racemase
MKTIILSLFFSTLAISCFAQMPAPSVPINDARSFYQINFAKYPKINASLSVGVFDSGTGGLTVFNAIVAFDEHNNQTGAQGKDGIPDFATEDFIYLADQANMPYGNYPAVGKTDFLKELILKDARFLLGNKYHTAQGQVAADKKHIKTLVIACNTATAYGKTDIEDLLKKEGSDLKVIGVIDAGAKGALETLKPNENASIGVFATAGTVASGGYTKAIQRLQKAQGYSGQVKIYSQGGVGLAEAIDEDLNYIDKKANAVRNNYKGPNVDNDKLRIERTLMDLYNFDFTQSKMLCDATKVADCSNLQINDAENYVRFHLVSMLEQMRQAKEVNPLKTLILGCTHYPYMDAVIQDVLVELRNAKLDGKRPYRKLLAKEIVLIDPSVNTARELYEHLQAQKLQNTAGKLSNAEFFITVPNTQLPGVGVEGEGSRFTYDYKYGRSAGTDLQYVQTAPFSRQNISASVADRLKMQIPKVYELIQIFAKESGKTKDLKPEQRL